MNPLESYRKSLQNLLGTAGLSCRMKENGDEPPLTLIISSLPIRVFVTGDLAYFAAILGKVNMAGDWCTWCGLSAKEWSPADHDKGQLWTLEAMAGVRESIRLGVTNDTSAGRQGCIDEPLRTCVPITFPTYFQFFTQRSASAIIC
jgi:hypothetical protein